MTTLGRAIETEKGVVVQTTRPAADNLSDEVMVVWKDKRLRSNDQIRKAWALLSEIAEYTGDNKEWLEKVFKGQFVKKYFDGLERGYWGLSNATMSEARDYIDMLIETVIEYGIQTKRPLVEYCEDVQRYVYGCLMNKRCAVCGRPCDLHHVETVGMGFNRNTIDHTGKACLPLCREHHTEAHNIGNLRLMKKYHLEPVEIDRRIAKKYGLKVD